MPKVDFKSIEPLVIWLKFAEFCLAWWLLRELLRSGFIEILLTGSDSDNSSWIIVLDIIVAFSATFGFFALLHRLLNRFQWFDRLNHNLFLAKVTVLGLLCLVIYVLVEAPALLVFVALWGMILIAAHLIAKSKGYQDISDDN